MKAVMECLNDFMKKENSTLDKYDVFMKKVWLTTEKPEPQAGEFAKCLKHLADSFTGANWKILYQVK